MNSKNGETSYPHRSLLNLTEEVDLRRGKKSFALSDFKTNKKIKKSKFKISASTWNDEFHLTNGLYSVLDYIILMY